MHFRTVGKEIFKGARKAQQLEAPGRDDPKVFARLRKIKLAKTLREAKLERDPRTGGYFPQHLLQLEEGYQVSEAP